MDFFLAEKAPRIEISRIYMSSGFLKIDITNSGESEARDIQISTAVATGVSNRFNVSFDQFYQKFAAPLKGRGMVLGKGSTTGIIMTWEDEVKKVLGYAPLDLKMMEEGDRPVFVKGSMMFVVNVFYKDLRQGFRMTTASAMMNPPNYEALLKAQKQEKEEEYAAAVEEFLQENRRQGTGLPSPVH
ncbi:hypothetical protein [Delftia tsuruhatensis]|uniref:hypothetical protein n=1 Tax=Delftia tsuruhatensis TaxID=180282 RepID=UPI002028E79C|nr:hypothetical protein [Delftia tsuruhatensis]